MQKNDLAHYSFDLIGIGALNVDYIIGRTACVEMQATFPRYDTLKSYFPEPDAPATDAQIQELLSCALTYEARCPYQPCLGGSAFNTIQTVRALDASLRLGFVGVHSINEVAGAHFSDWFRHNSVDRQHLVAIPGVEQGACVSLNAPGDNRRRRISSGASARFSKHFGQSGDAIVTYLSNARIVHVSAIKDTRAPKVVAEWLKPLAEQSKTLISFDPGPLWTRNPSGSIAELYRYADFLFVSKDELRALTGGTTRHSCPSGQLASEVMRRFAMGESARLFVKEAHHTAMFEVTVGSLKERRHKIAGYLEDDEIEDATGAGDTFAAGVLVGHVLRGKPVSAAVTLGHRLMRMKLRAVGTAAYGQFGAVLDRWTRGR